MNMPKSRDIQVKIPPGRIALRRRGIMSLKRPVAGGESCKQDSFLWILTRNCEGTEQLRLFYVCYSVSAHFYVILIINLFVVKCNKKQINK